jgi:hypothetical protein
LGSALKKGAIPLGRDKKTLTPSDELVLLIVFKTNPKGDLTNQKRLPSENYFTEKKGIYLLFRV